MKTRFFHEDDGWSADGCKITTEETLVRVRKCLEDEGPIIVEHWFYRGACVPDRTVFDDYEAFLEYLRTCAFAGDAIYIWSFAAVCRNENELAYGKCPDERGLVPERGAY